MKTPNLLSLKALGLLTLGVTSSLFLSSCLVVGGGGYARGYNSTYSVAAALPAGLIRTASSYWFYDPFRRSYYDTRRRAYFNSAANRYYSSPPRRHSTRVFPTGYSGRGILSAPRFATATRNDIIRNSVRRSQAIQNQANTNGNRADRIQQIRDSRQSRIESRNSTNTSTQPTSTRTSNGERSSSRLGFMYLK